MGIIAANAPRPLGWLVWVGGWIVQVGFLFSLFRMGRINFPSLRRKPESTPPSFRRRPESSSSSFRRGLHSSSFRRRPESILILPFLSFGFRRCRETDSRPCVFRPPSMAAGYFSLLAQKRSNQRKRHPRIRAARGASGSLRANGFRPQAIPGLLSKSARSIAPPALCAAFPFALRRCSEGTQELPSP